MDRVKKRVALPDILKGFAVFLVILGHCIQEGSGTAFQEESLYFTDKLYQFIYSFHMPLFMLVSGYFAWDSMKRGTEKKERRRLLGRKAEALLIPVFAWTVFEMAWQLAESGPEADAFASPGALAESFALGFLSTGWFLWAVFWCFLIVYMVHFYFRDSVLLYGAGFLVMYVMPDGLGLGAYKFMLPYFIAAFYFHRFQEQASRPRWLERVSGTNGWVWVSAAGVLFGVFFLFFDEYSMIYLSGYKLIGKDILRQLGIDSYRTVTGFAGAVFFILLWRKAAELAGEGSFRLLRGLGVNSLGLYLISGKVCLVAGQHLGEIMHPNYLLNLAEAVAVTAVSYILTIILEHIPVLRWLAGGKIRSLAGERPERDENRGL